MKKKIYDIVFAAQYEGLSTKEATDQLLVLFGVSDWVAVSERIPEVGVEVWAVTYNDDKVRKIIWGTGDEAFYEYWKVLNRPEPPCR